jgi:2-succinyl-6-hydroxy-2,4-cyclohexadiene-1-carboxylate synthase
MQLYYDIHDGTGPYVLMVHGFLWSRAQWGPNLVTLAGVARPVVLELWGHARSPAPAELALYHPDAYIAAFDQLRTQLGVEHWCLCGQSFGAALTLRYALTYPDRVIAQVFTNSSAALADAEWIKARRASGVQQAEEIERDGRAALERIRVHPIHARRLPPDVHTALLADAQLHTPRGIANTLRYTTPNVPVRERVSKTCGCRRSWSVASVKRALRRTESSPSTRSLDSGWSGPTLGMLSILRLPRRLTP